MAVLSITQTGGRPIARCPASLWDNEDGNGFDEDWFDEMPCEQDFEEGPMTEAQVQALIAADSVVTRTQPSSEAATPKLVICSFNRRVVGTPCSPQSISPSSA